MKILLHHFFPKLKYAHVCKPTGPIPGYKPGGPIPGYKPMGL